MNGFTEVSVVESEIVAGGAGMANRVPDTAGGEPATVRSSSVGGNNNQDYKLTTIAAGTITTKTVENSSSTIRTRTDSSGYTLSSKEVFSR